MLIEHLLRLACGCELCIPRDGSDSCCERVKQTLESMVERARARPRELLELRELRQARPLSKSDEER